MWQLGGAREGAVARVERRCVVRQRSGKLALGGAADQQGRAYLEEALLGASLGNLVSQVRPQGSCGGRWVLPLPEGGLLLASRGFWPG